MNQDILAHIFVLRQCQQVLFSATGRKFILRRPAKTARPPVPILDTIFTITNMRKLRQVTSLLILADHHHMTAPLHHVGLYIGTFGQHQADDITRLQQSLVTDPFRRSDIQSLRLNVFLVERRNPLAFGNRSYPPRNGQSSSFMANPPPRQGAVSSGFRGPRSFSPYGSLLPVCRH